MIYRVQVRDRTMNVFAFHDEPTFDRAVETAQAWAFLVGPILPIEIVFVLQERR
jgi:hypothetical protein